MKKGSLVKDYKGVKVFVTSDGVFFSDCVNNSDLYDKKTFNSEKLLSLEKAIDNFNGNILNENYYLLDIYPVHVTKFIAKSKVGDRIIFNDGSDSKSFSRTGLMKGDLIENTPEFQQFQQLVSIEDNLKDKIKLLEQERNINRKAAEALMLRLKNI